MRTGGWESNNHPFGHKQTAFLSFGGPRESAANGYTHQSGKITHPREKKHERKHEVYQEMYARRDSEPGRRDYPGDRIEKTSMEKTDNDQIRGIMRFKN